MTRTYAAFFLVLAACDAGEPGTITVTVDGVTGAEGLLLITEARDDDGNQAAVHCLPIDADPFSATVVLEEIVGPTPCEESSPINLDPGVYTLLTATIVGGETEPETCAEGEVEVDGDVEITMPALGACG